MTTSNGLGLSEGFRVVNVRASSRKDGEKLYIYVIYESVESSIQPRNLGIYIGLLGQEPYDL